MNLKEMRENRAKHVADIRGMADKAAAEGREFTSDEQSAWDKLNDAHDGVTRQIEVAERSAALSAAQEEAIETASPEVTTRGRMVRGEEAEELRQDAFNGWVRHQAGIELEERHEKAATELGMNLNARHLDIPLYRTAPKTEAEVRAYQGVGTDSLGGYTAPETIRAAIESAQLAHAGIRAYAQILRTADGNKINMPTDNDTSNEGSLLAENTQVSEQEVTLGNVEIDAYKFSSDLIRASYELLRDSNVDFGSYLGMKLGERLGRVQSTYFTTGTGSSQPQGAVTGSALGKTAAGAAAITSDELIDLFHSIDPAYRAGPGVAWQMADATVKLIRKLKDSDGQYIWEPGLKAGEPQTLLGRPVVTNQKMPAATTGLKSVIFGDFSKFLIRDAGAIRMKRLVERYADYDQEGFVGFYHGDSVLLDAGTNPIKHLIQA